MAVLIQTTTSVYYTRFLSRFTKPKSLPRSGLTLWKCHKRRTIEGIDVFIRSNTLIVFKLLYRC